jgi:hypothetical protein
MKPMVMPLNEFTNTPPTVTHVAMLHDFSRRRAIGTSKTAKSSVASVAGRGMSEGNEGELPGRIIARQRLSRDGSMVFSPLKSLSLQLLATTL